MSNCYKQHDPLSLGTALSSDGNQIQMNLAARIRDRIAPKYRTDIELSVRAPMPAPLQFSGNTDAYID